MGAGILGLSQLHDIPTFSRNSFIFGSEVLGRDYCFSDTSRGVHILCTDGGGVPERERCGTECGLHVSIPSCSQSDEEHLETTWPSSDARYICASSEMDHPFWWNKAKSGGPIVEQATHFCDIMRHLAGEVDLKSVAALAVSASDDKCDPGFLSAIGPVNKESSLDMKDRIPRLTASHWLFTSGAIGNLTHAVALHGPKYEAAIEVWADGLRMALEEPYFPECKLRVREGVFVQLFIYSTKLQVL